MCKPLIIYSDNPEASWIEKVRAQMARSDKSLLVLPTSDMPVNKVKSHPKPTTT